MKNLLKNFLGWRQKSPPENLPKVVAIKDHCVVLLGYDPELVEKIKEREPAWLKVFLSHDEAKRPANAMLQTVQEVLEPIADEIFVYRHVHVVQSEQTLYDSPIISVIGQPFPDWKNNDRILLAHEITLAD